MFTGYEQELFTRVVAMAEKEGKPVELVVVPGINPFDAMAHTASKLKGIAPGHRRVRAHGFGRTGPAHWLGLGEGAGASVPFALEIISPGRPSIFVNLGPHPPRLWPQDIELVHNMWSTEREVRGPAAPSRCDRGRLRRTPMNLGTLLDKAQQDTVRRRFGIVSPRPGIAVDEPQEEQTGL